MLGYQLSFDSIPVQPAPAPAKRQVLSRTRGRAKRDDAMRRAEEHANAEWKETALAIVKQVAESHARFTTDAVIAALALTAARTHEPRALGPVMQRARRNGWITGTGEFIKSEAISRHCAPKQVWYSNLYQQP